MYKKGRILHDDERALLFFVSVLPHSLKIYIHYINISWEFKKNKEKFIDVN